jgi:hypothetical protein
MRLLLACPKAIQYVSKELVTYRLTVFVIVCLQKTNKKYPNLIYKTSILKYNIVALLQEDTA